MDLIEKTLRLVEIPSETLDEAAICAFLHEELRGSPGFTVSRHANSLLLYPKQRTERPLVALVGHLDTVPARGVNEPRVEGDRVYGLGTSDMKGGLAILWQLIEQPVSNPAYDVCYIFYDAEEGPYVQNGLGPLFRDIPWLKDVELAIILEPTDNTLHLGCMGCIHATVTFRGRAAHSARPWHGENAVHKAAGVLGRLDALEPNEVRFGALSYKEVISATLASGGNKRNVVPDEFSLNLNSRFAPGRSNDSARQQILDLVQEDANVEFLEVCPSGPVPENNPILDRFRNLTGVPELPKQAWTDVAQFGVHGIDAVNFGPGDTAEAHQQNESMSINRLMESDIMFRRFLEASE
jgi:succinyl-diaminopimelate desuccinylase